MSQRPARQSLTELNLFERTRQQYTLVALIFAAFVLGLTLFTDIIGGIYGGQQVINTLLFIFVSAAIWYVWRGQFVSFVITALAFFLAMSTFLYFDNTLLVVFIAVAFLGSLFLTHWAYIATTGIVLLRFWVLLFGPERGRGGPIVANVNDSVTFILVTLLLGFLLYRFRNQVQQLVFRANRSNTLLEASAAVGQIIARELSLDKLLNQAVDTIRDRFAFYHVQVFLIDEARDYAKLVASTGEAGVRLLAREHKLLIGSQSVIGRVTQIGEPVIAHDTDVAGVHYRNELLPNTRSELALPIMDGDTIIGALDVQSARPNAFTDIDVQALQVVANLLATAIRNAKLFETQQRNLNENKRLFLEAEVNLREIQRLNRQLTGAAWTDFLRSREEVSGITLEDVEVRKESNWTKEMLDAVKRRRPITTERQGKQIVAVPIMLRGEVLGSIEVEVDPTQDETESVEMIQAIAERLAVSIDNARLFEEIQETSAAQQQINEIVGRYQTAGTVDDLLHITLEELSETLGAQRSAIRLSPRPTQDTSDGSPDTADQNGGSAS